MNKSPIDTFMDFGQKMREHEAERREWAENTPATLADIEDAVNYALSHIREAVHWYDIDDYKFENKNHEK